ncbi:restriction endonuclease [Halorussus limi]|uniref:Restriction endonuclease n=1 Tax=Halorussus limi TaxID=2938695 RepID=A0A8U0HW21_9EURY|nr:restriction endonuclease [Halorussus limi]UPV75315.1 restriction endonuclease [Halorussus limi]
MADTSGWMVRAGNDNELVDEFTEESIAAIGWEEVGDLSSATTREEVKARYRDANPNHSNYRVAVNAGQLFRFAHVMEEGDLVLTYDKSTRVYHVGTVEGSYLWKPNGYPESYPHVRRVNWSQTVSRDEFSTPVKNTLGSVLTVFSLDDRLDKIETVLSGEQDDDVDEEDDEETPPYFQEVQATAEELISDIIASIDPFDFEELVAALLRAMGYDATTTTSGPDQGVDVVAHPDALGFEAPYIKVQVKHRRSSTGGPDMREFNGTLGSGEKGLYISTGGFTSDAEQAAENTSQRVTLLDRDDFIDLLLQHYEDLEPEYQSMVPLKRVYIPTEQ